jgi:hypothetical protein
MFWIGFLFFTGLFWGARFWNDFHPIKIRFSRQPLLTGHFSFQLLRACIEGVRPSAHAPLARPAQTCRSGRPSVHAPLWPHAGDPLSEGCGMHRFDRMQVINDAAWSSWCPYFPCRGWTTTLPHPTGTTYTTTDQPINIPLMRRGRIEGCRVGQFG